GGQPGHRGARRELLPPDKVSKFVNFFPPECENCWKPLDAVPDALAKRYQSTELPPSSRIRPSIAGTRSDVLVAATRLAPRTTRVWRRRLNRSCCGRSGFGRLMSGPRRGTCSRALLFCVVMVFSDMEGVSGGHQEQVVVQELPVEGRGRHCDSG